MLVRYDLILSAPTPTPTGEATLLLTSPQPWDKRPRKGQTCILQHQGKCNHSYPLSTPHCWNTDKEGPTDGQSVAQLLLAVKSGKGFTRWILRQKVSNGDLEPSFLNSADNLELPSIVKQAQKLLRHGKLSLNNTLILLLGTYRKWRDFQNL